MGRGTARSAVEGLTGAAVRQNESHRRLDIAAQFIGRNPEGPESMLLQPPVPVLIPFGILPHLVRDAVDLDDELGLGTVEIDCVRPERMLSAELDAGGAC